jgi:steroid 5-alpha reductase family enzyme
MLRKAGTAALAGRRTTSTNIPKVVAVAGSLSALSTASLVFASANLVGFGVSAATGSHLHLDLIGTGAFAAAVYFGRAPGIRQLVSAACIGLWSSRLALFLFYRVLQVKHDARLDETLSTTSGAAGFWFISALWGIVCSLPHTLAAAGPHSARNKLDVFCIAGLSVFALGFCIESVADYQKWRFKQDPENQGRFCDVGLWSLSQHPNYMGNLVLWSGILLLNAPCLAPRPHLFVAAAFSPIFMFGLFYGQASGGFTNTLELMEAKYGRDPAFRAYTDNVPLIFPSPFSQGAQPVYTIAGSDQDASTE